jgi:predicted RNA-binding Zn-ribbon protein involved in translation (DUF1610 family)
VRARKVKEAYECPACGEFHEGDPTWVQAWRVVDLNGEELTTTEPESIDAAMTECGETVVASDIEVGEAYRCGECDEVYEDRESAAECCR